MTKIRRDFKYAPGSTEIATPLLEVLTKRSGVCQDFAHLMIACLRSAGLSARYVSGYLRTHARGAPPPLLAAVDDDDDDDQDFIATGSGIDGLVAARPRPESTPTSRGWHRGCAARTPRTPGWRCLRRRSAGSASIQPTTCASTRTTWRWPGAVIFGDVSPLRGVILGGGSHRLRVRVAVRQIEDPP